MQKETAQVRFLYQTEIGRCLLKILVQPWVSKTADVYLNSRLSRWLVGVYIRKYNIDLSEFTKNKYKSFNDFFTRERSECNIDASPENLISPCDSYLTAYRIGQDSIYKIKHVEYNLEQLLGDAELAKNYAGGVCLIFRLTPRHYHRYCYVCDGIEEASRRIDGKLHCVRPIAYTSVPVFVQNSREYTVLESKQLGTVVQMEVGALLVGKIKNHLNGCKVMQGAEKGYFEFGGSTIIVLLEKDRVDIDGKIFERSEMGVETEVRLGLKIGEVQHKLSCCEEKYEAN